MKRARILLPFLMLLAMTTLSHAQADVADFYRGKTVTIYVGLPPGGGFDIYARLIGKFLGAHIPGEPSVIVQNMPGAGSLLMASYIYNAATQDGTAIGAPSTNIPFQPLVDAVGVKYDSLKMNWLPSPTESTTALLVSSSSPVKKVEDMRGRDTAIGSIAPGSPPTIGIGLYNEVLKTKMRPVLGYAGLPSIMLAIERGEVEGYATMPLEILRQSYKHLMESGKLRVLLQSGDTRAPELADVRTARELVTNRDDLELLNLGSGFTKTSYPYMMGPGVPPDRLAAMRRAFMETFADPQFREEAAQRDIQIRPVTAENVTRSIHEGFKTPDATVSRLRNIFERVR